MGPIYIDCKDCRNSDVKDGKRTCAVKHIDCSVRQGKMPCSHARPKIVQFRFRMDGTMTETSEPIM